jgi:hypothetical protein
VWSLAQILLAATCTTPQQQTLYTASFSPPHTHRLSLAHSSQLSLSLVCVSREHIQHRARARTRLRAQTAAAPRTIRSQRCTTLSATPRGPWRSGHDRQDSTPPPRTCHQRSAHHTPRPTVRHPTSTQRARDADHDARATTGCAHPRKRHAHAQHRRATAARVARCSVRCLVAAHPRAAITSPASARRGGRRGAIVSPTSARRGRHAAPPTHLWRATKYPCSAYACLCVSEA